MSTTRAVSDTILIPEAPPIESLRFRHYRGQVDHPAMAELNTASRAANGMVEVTTTESIDVGYAHPVNCDLTRDFVAAELDGRLVGYGRNYWVDRNDGTRSFDSLCHLDPTVRGRGIGSAMFAWQRRRIAEIHGAMPDDRRSVATAYIYGQDLAGRAMVEAASFKVVRRFAQLVRPDLEAIVEVPMPNGFEVRAVDPNDGATIRRVWEAGAEAFADHWGESADEWSDDQYAGFLESPETAPELWQVAFHGDEVAGHILNYLGPIEPDGTRTGWTEAIAVRRAYRRRGVARALLARSLQTVRDAGATRAALGVDTENVNHALDLYEGLGFRVIADEFVYQGPVEQPAVTR